MKILLTAAAVIALGACAKNAEPAAPASPEEPAAPAPIGSEDLGAAAPPQAVAETPVDTPSVPSCPVIDSRSWKAWTSGESGAATLFLTGEVDLPTPGYAVAMVAGVSDRAMPPGLRVILTATPPEGLVAQVVTPTAVAYEQTGAYPEYRSVTILCGDATLGEIAPVSPGLN